MWQRVRELDKKHLKKMMDWVGVIVRYKEERLRQRSWKKKERKIEAGGCMPRR